MKQPLKALLCAASAVVLLGAGVWLGQGKVAFLERSGRGGGAQRVLYYVAPMNPAHTAREAGLAPCGMKMEPVYAPDSTQDTPFTRSASRPVGTVAVTAEQQQLIGVRLGVVAAKPALHNLRLLGKVAVQEHRLYRVVANVNGMITKTCPHAPGSRVKKEEPLATMYSPEFTGGIQSLLTSLASQDRAQALAKEGPGSGNSVSYYGNSLQNNLSNLKYLGFGETQLQEIVNTRNLTQNTDIVSPGDGVILMWAISPGLRFDKGAELLRIADLSKVWILADLNENEASFIQTGLAGRVTLSSPQRTLTAKVSELIPQFDGVSRNLKVRLEVDNDTLALQPDMFVQVEFSVRLPEGLAIPMEAVLDSGLRQTVYVHQGDGLFAPREVTIGRHLGDQVEILQGLEPGEQIVLAGNFLLDSESRMKQAAGASDMKPTAVGGGMAPDKDPVCGMAIEAQADQTTHLYTTYQGTTYVFCANTCKQRFEKDPAQFSAHAAKLAGRATPF